MYHRLIFVCVLVAALSVPAARPGNAQTSECNGPCVYIPMIRMPEPFLMGTHITVFQIVPGQETAELFGEIYNPRAQAITLVTVTVRTFDANNQFLAEHFDNVDVNVLPGERQPFRVPLGSAAGIATYTLEWNWRGLEAIPYYHLTILSSTMTYNRETGTTVSATVRNDQSFDLIEVAAQATFYDDAGNVIFVKAVGSVWDQLAPGQTKTYTIDTLWDFRKLVTSYRVISIGLQPSFRQMPSAAESHTVTTPLLPAKLASLTWQDLRSRPQAGGLAGEALPDHPFQTASNYSS